MNGDLICPFSIYQTTAYEPKELEAEFHNVTDKLTGKPLQHLYANKGL